MIARERCESCGRFKLYNTGGGLICTNISCKDGITVEQDHKEVDAIRQTLKTNKMSKVFISNAKNKTLKEKGEPYSYPAPWLTEEMDGKEFVEGVDFELKESGGVISGGLRPMGEFGGKGLTHHPSFYTLPISTPSDKPVAEGKENFQNRVDDWLLKCLGENIARDKQERNHRFIEEALELVQSCGATESECQQLVSYVFGRPIGEINQEVGGVIVTLAALCLAQGISMNDCGETELKRIWTKIDKIREKQATKPQHSPLPATPAIKEDVEQKANEWVKNNPSGYTDFNLNDAMDEGKLKGFKAGWQAKEPVLSDGVDEYSKGYDEGYKRCQRDNNLI